MKNVRFWLLVLLVVASRVVSFLYLKGEPSFVYVPRSFLGGGFQVHPALLDLMVPVIVILCLWPLRRPEGTIRRWGPTLWDGVFLLLFALTAGLSLFAFDSRWQLLSNLTMAAFLRWLQFLGAYVACNMLLDELPVKNRWIRIPIAAIFILCLGPLHDTYRGMQDSSLIQISVGTTLMWTVIALRRRYCQSPVASTTTAAIVGGASCLVIVTAPSNSLFTAYWPILALLLGALTVRSGRSWPRWAALASIAGVGLLLSLAVPRFLPPAERAGFLAQDPPAVEPIPSHAEEVEGVTVRYEDVRVREVAVRLAHVLAAANKVSQETYGISPQVNEVIIRGLREGGFEAEFPHRIRGNVSSPRELDLCVDSTFLNDPNASIHFPDPVNSILHEFSHLYGTVPYSAWVMDKTEEEGWATFSATRLSRRLYDRFGPGLWNPPYNYAARADAITQSNLAGHPVYWSHPEEYGGFRLWYLLAQRDGEVALYRKRWALTRRDIHGWWLQSSDPNAARRMAEAFGYEDFAAFGAGQVVRYDQVYALRDVQAGEEALGHTADEVKENYATDASRLIDPTIKVPPKRPIALDIGLSLGLLVLFPIATKLNKTA